MARSLLGLAAVLGLLLAAAALPPGAGAHALPVRMSPGSGEVVTRPPFEVVITFSEALDPSFSRLEVRDANGTLASEPSSIDADGLTVRARLPRDLAFGAYTVAWRALSKVDSHATRGLASFLFPDPSKPLDPGQLPSAEAREEVLVGPEDPALRALGFAGIFVTLGVATLALLVAGRDAPQAAWPWERRLGALALGAALVGAAATVLLAATQAAAAAEASLAATLARPGATFTGRLGALAGARASLLVASGLLAWTGARSSGASPRRALWGLAAGLALAGLATVSLSSHAAALPRWGALATAIDALHMAAAAAWVGGLVGLGWVLWRPNPRLPLPTLPLAQRFSALALACVAIVVLSGALASVLQLKTLDALLATSYGQVLLAKVALVGGLLAFGAHHRFRGIPAMAAGREGAEDAARRFGRSVRAEAALGIAVVVVAGALTSLSPPAPDAAGPEAPTVLELSQVRDGVNVTLLVSPYPVRVGFATLDVFLTEPATGVALNDTTSAAFTFRPPDRTLGDSEARAQQAHPAHFAAEGAFFTMPGLWTVRILVQRASAYDILADFELEVAENGA